MNVKNATKWIVRTAKRQYKTTPERNITLGLTLILHSALKKLPEGSFFLISVLRQVFRTGLLIPYP